MDELLHRRTPSNIEAEQAVIGSMILDSRCLPDVIEVLRPEDFYLRENREIYETIHSMFSLSQPVDPVTLIDRMQQRGVYTQTTEQYIRQLLDVTPVAANVRFYADIVRDKALLRSIAEAAGEINTLVYDGEGEARDVLDQAEQKIYDIRHRRTVQEFKTIGEALGEVYDRLNELAKNKGKLPGLTTGFGELDSITTGMNKTDLVLLASRPGMGKTSLALNMALSAAKANEGAIAIFSLEMSREQLAMRLLSGEGMVDSNKLMTGNLDAEDWGEIVPASERLAALNILIDDNPAITPAAMKAKCRRVKNLSMVIIDYLQLMTAGGKRNDNRVQEVGEISRSLKIMAKELSVPVLCLSQLSRANEKRPDKKPVMSDLRESGSIEQDADIIMFIYRDNYYNPEAGDGATIDVAKNRHGRTGKIDVRFIPEYTTFVATDRQHSDEDEYQY